MGDVLFAFDVNAKPETIHRALTTAEGVAGFWTEDANVPAEVGKTLTLRLPDAPGAFDLVLTQSDDDVISWRTKSFPPQWVGTDIDGRFQAQTTPRRLPSGMAHSPTEQSKGRWGTCGARSWCSSSSTPRLGSPRPFLSTPKNDPGQ